MERHWYKEGVMYTLDIRSFKDGNNDGMGDFKGLIDNFDYLVELGVTSLWILPFYCSENKDAGYDVIDYYTVDPQLGSLEDFKEFIEKAQQHNIKVLIDLVVNHTSNQHRWFKEAVKDVNSKYRKYYIWLDERPENHDDDVVFKNVEDSNWEYHQQAKAFYYHTFYSHQPDLNVANSAVQEEIVKIEKFWMDLGVSGFRIDAVPHIMRDKGNEKFKGDPYEVLDRWQQVISEHNRDAILIAEADVEPEKYRDFLGHGERIHGLLNFYLNNHIFLALATMDPKPLIDSFKHIPALEDNEQYLIFLRNHDELDLERLQPDERQKVFEAFAPDENMRIYDRGIRRRLPPMINNDKRVIELSLSLLFSLPGTPVCRYGDEIGMGDDLKLEERNSVRTSMQWDDSKNGGFSSASPDKLFWPVISGGEYGYEKVNVSAQKKDPSSLLNITVRMISIRKELIEFGYGDFKPVDTGNPRVMCHSCKWQDRVAFAFHNFSNKPAIVSVDVGGLFNRKIEQVLGNCKSNAKDNGLLEIELQPFGYSWWKSS